jgi:hypothetical protein
VAWEAVVVIGGFCVLLGLLLYLPARLWAKHRLRNAPAESAARLQVTSAGLAFAVLTVGLTLAGSLQSYLAPETEFGQFLATGVGRVLFVGAAAIVSGIVAMVLELLGFTLFRRPRNEK